MRRHIEIRDTKRTNFGRSSSIFFEALGWDVKNKRGVAPQYRDVIYEDSIKVAKGTKAPDYAFTLAGRKMLFVEAKKPAINIYKSPESAYQLRMYA
jgi:hypothetical protein